MKTIAEELAILDPRCPAWPGTARYPEFSRYKMQSGVRLVWVNPGIGHGGYSDYHPIYIQHGRDFVCEVIDNLELRFKAEEIDLSIFRAVTKRTNSIDFKTGQEHATSGAATDSIHVPQVAGPEYCIDVRLKHNTGRLGSFERSRTTQ